MNRLELEQEMKSLSNKSMVGALRAVAEGFREAKSGATFTTTEMADILDKIADRFIVKRFTKS